MRHQHIRRSATNAGYPPPPPVIFSVIGAEESGYTTDDVTWTGIALPLALQNTTWNNYAYGEKGFLAVGESNFFAFSKTGKSWIPITAPVSGKSWVGCAYSPTLNLYLVMASDGTNYRTSDPEAGWTAGTTLSGSLTVNALEWIVDKFVVVAHLGTNRYRHSANGITWTNITEANVGNGLNFAVTKLDDNRYILGQNGNFRHTLNVGMISWTAVTVSGAGQLRQIIDSPVRFIMYTPGTPTIYRYLKSSPASGVSHNAGTGRLFVNRGHYRSANNRFYVLLDWAAFPTRHVRFDPSVSGVPSWEYIDRGVASGATILCSRGI